MLTERIFDSSQRILVVAAHPDDEILGCGGTLARARHGDVPVSVLYLGEGIAGRFPVGQYDTPEFHEQTAIRNQSAERALGTLSIDNFKLNSRISCQFDTVPMQELTHEIESAIEAFRPTVLLTHNPSEVNIDHKITHLAVENACRPTRPWIPRLILAFEIVCSGSWTFESTFKPNLFIDVTAYWQQKMKAWHNYEEESRPFPFPRSDRGLETLARYRGMQAGVEMAEAFRVMRAVL